MSLVDRAARILACFDRNETELTLPKIAQRLGLPKPTAFRILGELARHGLVEHDRPANCYRLGFGVLRLAEAVLEGHDIRAKARPAMQLVRDAVNETIILSLRDGDHRINLDSVDGRQVISGVQQLGVRIPLYSGAASQILLAGMSDTAIDDYLARTRLTAFSNNTLTSSDAVRTRLATVRRDGHAISFGEFTHGSGACAIAVPVRRRDGTTIAALHVSVPQARLTPDLQALCLSALTTGSKALTASLE